MSKAVFGITAAGASVVSLLSRITVLEADLKRALEQRDAVQVAARARITELETQLRDMTQQRDAAREDAATAWAGLEGCERQVRVLRGEAL